MLLLGILTLTVLQSGLLPRLLAALQAHSELARSASNAYAIHDALEFLERCRTMLIKSEELLKEGRLPEAARNADDLQKFIHDAPPAVSRSLVMLEMKVRSPLLCFPNEF